MKNSIKIKPPRGVNTIIKNSNKTENKSNKSQLEKEINETLYIKLNDYSKNQWDPSQWVVFLNSKIYKDKSFANKFSFDEAFYPSMSLIFFIS